MEHDHAHKAETSPERLDRLVENMANKEWDHCKAIEEQLSIRHPWPLPLRWAITVRPVHDDVRPSPSHAGMSGNYEEIIGSYRRIPSGRLAVLGDAGQGKTVLVVGLTLALLSDRKPGDPVPVLLSAQSWNPPRESFNRWLAIQLMEKNRLLYSREARSLISGGRIIPILDALDEIARPEFALYALNLVIAKWNQPLIVTCRTAEYERAVRAEEAERPALLGTSVIEILPLRADDVAAYLRASDANGNARQWDRLSAHLHANPGGALVRTLSSPRMVWLARATYATTDRDPSELIDMEQSGGRTAVEDHLLQGLVPAAYAAIPGQQTLPRKYSLNAPRWLSLIARTLMRDRGPESAASFVWWRVGLPAPLPTILAAVFSFTVGALAAGILSGAAMGFAAAIVSFLAFGWDGDIADFYEGTSPSKMLARSRMKALITGFALSVEGGLAFGLIFAAAGHPNSRLVDGLVAFPAAGLTTGFLLWLTVSTHRAVITCMAASTVGIIVALNAGLLLGGLASGLTGMTAAAFLLRARTRALGASLLMLFTGLPVGLALGLGSALAAWTSAGVWGTVVGAVVGAAVGGFTAILIDPALASDAIGTAAAVALATAIMAAPAVILKGNPSMEDGELVGALVLGSAFLIRSEWTQFTLYRIGLAATGQLPWRLMAFLADARSRRILRQVGGVYEFRHPRHQEVLASQTIEATPKKP